MSRKLTALLLIITFFVSYIPPDLVVKAAGPLAINRVYLKTERDSNNVVTLSYEIHGTNFSSPKVYIDDKEILPSYVTESIILIRRTSGADDGIFEVGMKDIKVQNQDDETVNIDFNVVVTPHITSVNKTKVYVGEALEIYGTGFNDLTSVIVAGESYSVGLEGSGSQAIVASDYQKIVIDNVKAPIVYGPSEVKVTKNAGGGTETPIEDAIQGILKECISVVGKLTNIEVISLEPDSGHISGGTVIRMMGNVAAGKSQFNSSMRVFIGGAEATGVQVIVNDSGTVVGLQATTPPGTAGESQIIIQDADGHNEYIVPKSFTYVQASNMLVVTGVLPSFAKESEGKEITVSGRNIATLNISQLQNVTLDTDQGYDLIDNEYTLTYKGEYNDNPVTIERKIKLIMGEIAPIIEIVKRQINGDQILATTPVITLTEEGIPEVHDVVIDTETIVTDEDGQQVIHRMEKYTLSNAFTYLPDKTIPEILSITPDRGPWDQDIYITIKGSNFQVLTEEIEGVQVTRYPVITIGPRIIDPNDDPDNHSVRVYDNEGHLLDGKKYTIGTEIRTILPAGNLLDGFASVNVTNPDEGTSTAPNLFRFMDPQLPEPDKPRIDRLEPDRGTTNGGTEVKIYGHKFDNDIDSLIVTIDGAEALIKEVRSLGNEITIITPPGIEGYKTVQVINGDGAMATLEDGYYYTRVTSDPVIYSIAPEIGGEGTWVIIRGHDFRPTDPGSSIIDNKLGTRVLLDGQDINGYLTDEYGNISLDGDGNIMFEDDGQRTQVLDEYTIKVIIPPGLSTGFKDVSVLNPDTANYTVNDGFEYRNPTIHPEIISIDPAEGTVEGGTVVTIHGSQFWDDIRVFFGGYEATSVTVNGDGDMIQAITPGYPITTPGAKSEDVDVTVVNYNGGSDTLENGFEYMIPDSIPLITSIDPNWGSTAGEDTVIIFGREFLLEYDGDEISRLPEIYFGGVKAVNVRWDNHNRLTVITPAYSDEGRVDVTVVNPDAGSYTAQNAFEYRRSSPQITSVTPNKGNKTGDQEITIKGSGFIKGDLSAHYQGELVNSHTPDADTPWIDQLVVFGDEKSSAYISGGRSEVTVGNIRAVYDSTQPGNNTTLFYTPPSGPEVPISNYNINMGTYHLFIINGPEDLDDADIIDEAIRVDVSQDTLAVTRRVSPYVRWVSDGILAVKTPPVSYIGQRNLYVINKDGGTATGTFEYMSPDSNPQITDIRPNREMYNEEGDLGGYVTEGSVDADTYVTIDGTDFRTGVKVFVDDIETEVISRSNDDDQIIIKVPPGGDQYLGRLLKFVVVNQDGGTADSSLLHIPRWFEYQRPESNPVIDSISPEKTSAMGGNKLSIFGYDFRSGAKVIIGGKEAVNTDTNLWSYREIFVLTPQGLASGVYDVQVINPDFGTATKEKAITIVSCPSIEYITNQNGSPIGTISFLGGDTIMLKGLDFQPGATVVFGGEIMLLAQAPSGEGIQGIDSNDREIKVVGGSQATGIEVLDANTISLTTPAGVEGDTTIIVINSDGGISEEYSLEYTLPIPGAPEGLDVSLVYDRYVRLEWPEVEDALYYEIYASEDDRYDFRFIASTTRNVYYVIDLDSDTRYYFMVKAINKFGSSEFTSHRSIRTDDTREPDPDGSINETEKILVEQDRVTVNIGEDAMDRGAYYAYHIDLTDAAYSKISLKQINIPLEVIREAHRTFMVSTQELMLQFSPTALNVAPLWSKTGRQRDEVYGRLTIDLSPKAEGDRARKYLPVKHRVVSNLCYIGLTILDGKTTQQYNEFNSSIDIQVKYDYNKLNGIKESALGLYRFDPMGLRWEQVQGSGVHTDFDLAYGRMTRPGIYAVLGKN